MKTHLFLIALVLIGITTPTLQAESRLDARTAQKLEIRHSMIGFRNTLLFYTFKDERAILQLIIDNQDETFPITGKLLFFETSTTAEQMDMWINNQHSDGLFPEVPEPMKTIALPKDRCKITSRKWIQNSPNPGPENNAYKEFEIGFSVEAWNIDETHKLAPFQDIARVHVKSAS